MLPFGRRQLDGMTPGVGHPEANAARDWATQLVTRMNDVRQAATILAAAANVVLALDSALDGQPVFVTLNGAADGTLTSIVSTVWDGDGNLTITGNAAATADKALAVFVPGLSRE